MDPRPGGRAIGAALLGCLLFVAALTFDTVSLYVPGVALVILAVVAALWVALVASGAKVQRAAGPHTVEEEQPYPVRIELKRGALAPVSGELSDPLLNEPIALGGRAADRVRIDVRFARRGWRTIEPGRFVITDPLRICSRELAVSTSGTHVLVLPRVDPLVAAPGGGGAKGSGLGIDGGGRALSRGRVDGSVAELDVDGLRPYREGAPASRIHWPAVARGGDMVERRLTAESDSAPLVVLDASRPPSDDALDAAVRAAASVCLHLARRGGCACLVPGDRRPTYVARDLAAWPALHARLALVVACATRTRLSSARHAGAVIWVSARLDPPRELARAALGGVWAIRPVDESSAARPVFTVAGCEAVRVRGAVGLRGGVAA